MSDETPNEQHEERDANVQQKAPVQNRGEKGDKDEALSRLGEQRDKERERANSLEAELESIKATQREADEAKALEEGNYKQLLEQREAELAELKDTLTKREMSDKRRELARKHKVHEDDMELVDLITATDDDEVETWVKRIAKRSAVTDGLDTDSGKRSAQGNGKQKPESLLANYEFGKRR